eukprot:14722169-Alexandrium_andersonii.AAC.1
MVAVPEDEKLWEDLGKIAVANLGDWYQRVPPVWSCRTGHLFATSVPDKIERTVKLLEELMSSIAPI